MSIIGAETIGTALLILLGDGVVAAVLLTKSKAQDSGWVVITFGWGFGVNAKCASRYGYAASPSCSSPGAGA